MKTRATISKTRKTIHVLLFVIFLLFTLLQLNDPDPMLWVFIYGVIAFIPLVSNYRTIPKKVLWLILIALLIYAASYFTYLIDWLQTEDKEAIFGEMVYEKPYLEGSREFIGLIMGALAVFYVLRE